MFCYIFYSAHDVQNFDFYYFSRFIEWVRANISQNVILIEIVRMEPEAIVTYCELGDIRAISAKFNFDEV